MSKGNGRNVPLNALRAFEAAARHLSFKKAAKELHVTAGAVSHQIKVLEENLGVALFRRLTRALELTPEAQSMLPKVREGLDNLLEAVGRVRARDNTTSLTVIAPPNFAARWLVPRLSRFTTRHPNLELHVASRPSMIDGRESSAVPDPVADAREDSPLVMVRFGNGRYPGQHVEEVFSARYVPVCSPKLLAGEHPLRTPDDLRFHRCCTTTRWWRKARGRAGATGSPRSASPTSTPPAARISAMPRCRSRRPSRAWESRSR
jgi:LysR family transcriptional regulator, glycine cleavage system transcriptional activator